MPSSKHEIKLNAPISNVWEFIANFNSWAPLMPGYIEHEIKNKEEATWIFLADLGFAKKKVKLQVDKITKTEQVKISFYLNSVEDHFDGNGYFQIETCEEGMTNLIGSLELSSGGFMGVIVNNVLKSFVPKTTEELVIRMGEIIKEKTWSTR